MECILGTVNQKTALGWVESANEGWGMLNARQLAVSMKAKADKWHNVLPEDYQLVCPSKEKFVMHCENRI